MLKDKFQNLTEVDYVNLLVFLEVSDSYDLTDNLKRIRIELLTKLKPD
jgi:hypothetical protein